jgi:glycosyltransferase involved in cell wall biosynthesis
MVKSKLVFISNLPSPHQVAVARELVRYFDYRFWYYIDIEESNRPMWWKVELPPYVGKFGRVLGKRLRRWYSPDIVPWLEDFDPDVIMLGGLPFPGNYVAYRWGVRHGKCVIAFTESLRNQKTGVLRGRNMCTALASFLYREIDAILTSSAKVTDQIKRVFPRWGDITYTSRYACDIDSYLEHPLREPSNGYRYFFPNRLIPIYNPLGALEVFRDVTTAHPQSTLKMNSQGELFGQCTAFVRQNGLEDKVSFVTDRIKSWADMGRLYRESDILIFPATFSNGNFTIIEAMASGLGIVISDKVLGNDLYKLRDGDNGFVREPSRQAFLTAVQRYIDDPQLLKQHALVNREIVRPLGPAGTARHYFELIQEVTRKKGLPDSVACVGSTL